MSPHPSIPESLWNTVPPQAQVAILAVIASLEKRIADLEKTVAELQARLNLDWVQTVWLRAWHVHAASGSCMGILLRI